MQRSAPRFVLFSIGVLILATVGWVLSGSAASQPKARISMSTDWSHQHLIFSRPGSTAELARVQQDPRYWQQLYREQQQMMVRGEDRDWADRFRRHFFPVRRDWAQDLGTGTTSPGTAPGLYAAKFSFDINEASCGSDPTPDFVVFSTGLLGSSSQASVVAYDNLYKGCPSGTVPSVYWAYNTGGQVLTSPIVSQDGTQVAFVETNGGFGILVLLKWAASGGSFSAPASISTVLPASYQGCTAPCMTQVALHDSHGTQTDDQTSSVFYDYKDDIAWMGGAFGWLHQVTGVFKGTPTEVTTGGFPVQVNSGNPTSLSSPVYDSGSQSVFVGDYGGFLYRVNASNAGVTAASQLDFGTGIVESPIVDSAAGLVYVFSSSDGLEDCLSSLNCAAVFQLPVSFSANAFGSETTVGESSASGNTPNPLYIGAFDSAYFSSTTRTGNLYVCGNTGGNPTIYQVSIVAGVTPASGIAVAQLPSNGSTAACSPVTDIPNPNGSAGPIERIFVSTQNNGSAAICAGGGCLSSFVDTPWTASTMYNYGQQVLSTRLHTETVVSTMSSESGLTPPVWSSRPGQTTSDFHVTWIDQGTVAPTLSGWSPSTTYTANSSRIIDSNGNVEVAVIGGKSGTSAPSWSTIIGNTTNEGTGLPSWVNAGPFASASIAATGGASGIIWDNIVSPITLNGASQIYFSTLGNESCTGGTGGCAVQASQAGLQ